jgi:hypothetical protein
MVPLYSKTDETDFQIICDRGWVDPRVIVRMEGLGQLRNLMASWGIEPAVFVLAVQCLNNYATMCRILVPARHKKTCTGRTKWLWSAVVEQSLNAYGSGWWPIDKELRPKAIEQEDACAIHTASCVLGKSCLLEFLILKQVIRLMVIKTAKKKKKRNEENWIVRCSTDMRPV